MSGRKSDAIASVIMLTGLYVMLGAPLTLAWQGLTWLRYGSWPEITIRDGFTWMGVSVGQTGAL